MMKKLLCLALALICLLSLASCTNGEKPDPTGEMPVPTAYHLDDQGNLIVTYNNGSTAIMGSFADRLKLNVDTVVISEDGYYVVNGVKSAIAAKLPLSYALDAQGNLIVTYTDTTTESLGALSGAVNAITSVSVSEDGFYVLNGIKTSVVAFTPVDFSQLSYAAVGDSITFGCSSAHPTQYDNGGYPQLVADILGLKEVENCGTPGAQVSHMIGAAGSARRGTDIISFMGGVNDCNNNVPLGHISDNTTDTFYGRLNLLSEKILSRFPDAFVFYMTPFPSGRTNHNTPNAEGCTLEDYAAAVRAVAARYGIPVLDLYFESGFEEELKSPESDGIHPSAEFFELYTAPQIAQFIKEYFERRS